MSKNTVEGILRKAFLEEGLLCNLSSGVREPVEQQTMSKVGAILPKK